MENILQYANAVAELIENAEVKEVVKANGITKVGVMVKQGQVSPTVYVEEMYNEGMPVEKAAEEIKKIAEQHRVDGGFDVQKYCDYEGFVKERLRARLYNKKTPAEVKRSASQRGFKDLIIIPYVEIPDFQGGGAIKVLKEHVEKWGVTEKEVIDQALKNSEADVDMKSLFGFMLSINPLFAETQLTDIPDGPMIISNKKGVYGASAILGLIPGLKKRYEKGFFIIPSSIHEVLLYPNDGTQTQAMLDKMVEEVNRDVVDPEEVLADKAYAFGV